MIGRTQNLMRDPLDRSWDAGEEIRKKISERLPEMKARARRTNELLVGLLADR